MDQGASHVESGMIHGALQSVQRAFNWAVKQGKLESSPIANLEKPPSGRRENVISPEMFVTIIGHVKDAAFRDLLITAWEVGCRPQEIRRVEARHHDNQRWVFPKNESKGKKKIRVESREEGYTPSPMREPRFSYG
jgi:integrase